MGATGSKRRDKKARNVEKSDEATHQVSNTEQMTGAAETPVITDATGETTPTGAVGAGENSHAGGVEQPVASVHGAETDSNGNVATIYVQFMPDNPYALTKFGALLKSEGGVHSLTALDGTGLARSIGFREGDVILAINNIQTSIEHNTSRDAVLQCLADIGTKIGIIIRRQTKKSSKALIYAFHLNVKDGKPVATNIFKEKQKKGTMFLPFSLADVIPEASAFPTAPVYTFDGSREVRLVLDNMDRYMRIGTQVVDYIITDFVVTMYLYEPIDTVSEAGAPIALAASVKRACPITPPSITGNIESDGRMVGNNDVDGEDDDDDDDGEKMMCISGLEDAVLNVVDLPPFMTEPGTRIPDNDMIFSLFINQDETAGIQAPANRAQYMSYNQDGDDYIAALLEIGQAASFKVEYQGRILTSVKELFHSQSLAKAE